jgi:hypothetical protein
MNHSEICHLYFSEKRRDTTQNRNIFIAGNTIYSYGHHFPLATEFNYLGSIYLFVNTANYSVSTNKHQNHLRRAINKNIYQDVFYCDFPSVYGSGYYAYNTFVAPFKVWNEFFESSNKKIKNYLSEHLNARLNQSYFISACSLIAQLKKFKELFNLTFDVENFEDKHQTHFHDLILKGKQAEEKRDEKRKRQTEINRLNDLEKLPLWLTGEYMQNLYHLEKTYLRLSKDKESIQTSRGRRVSLKAALIAHKAILSGKGIGAKIDGFTVIEANLDHIKIGCHVIGWPEINAFLETNNLL